MKVLSVSLIPGPSPEGRREITESLAATFTLTFMAVATPEDEKSASIVGAGFKPALQREIGSIRHGTALGGFEHGCYKTVLRPYVCDVFHAKLQRIFPKDEISMRRKA